MVHTKRNKPWCFSFRSSEKVWKNPPGVKGLTRPLASPPTKTRVPQFTQCIYMQICKKSLWSCLHPVWTRFATMCSILACILCRKLCILCERGGLLSPGTEFPWVHFSVNFAVDMKVWIDNSLSPVFAKKSWRLWNSWGKKWDDFDRQVYLVFVHRARQKRTDIKVTPQRKLRSFVVSSSKNKWEVSKKARRFVVDKKTN